MTQTLPTLDVPEALDYLRAAVAKRGADYVDPSSQRSIGNCQYAPGNGDRCIVGEVLEAHGVDDLVMVALDIEAVTIDIEVAVQATPFITEAARAVLYEAQSTQDRGNTWGVALEEAEDVARQYVARVNA